MSHDPEVKAMLTECHRILKDLEASTARAAAPVVTPGEAQRLVGKQSPSALYRWLAAKQIKPLGQGRYSRAQIERALADEAGVSYRRHQISKRRTAA